MRKKQETPQKENYENSTFIRASFGAHELFGQWVGAAFGFTVFFFYEAVIGLNTILAALAYTIWNIWNAVNDPLVGYMMEHHKFFWEKKWGYRRMPFLISCGILWLVCYLTIFLVPLNWNPVSDQWLIFAYYVTILVVYDLVNTLYDVNAVSLFPDKFTGLNERRSVTGFGTTLGIVGLVLAAIIPPMFITTGVASTYRNSAMATLLIGLLLFGFILPGLWETKNVREKYRLQREAAATAPPQGFLRTVKTVFENRRFVCKIILFFGYQVGTIMLETSALYVVTYLLDAPASYVTLLYASILLGALISTPVWMHFSKKVNNNRKLSIIAGFMMSFALIPLVFITGTIGWMISLMAFGVSLGGQWFMDPVTMGDVLDDVAVKTGKRDPGVYYGYQALIIKLGQSTIAVTIAIVHTLTGFVAGAPTLAQMLILSPTPDLALFGIRIHSALVPAILIFVATLLFWKFYDLTPDKVASNKAKLKEMGI
ncbi:MAG TPA: MFS transporter [Candidatus Lokiarchaeia archaeon]|nr:MFS transporter [Candidatus Lokiarchaeia archaeon]